MEKRFTETSGGDIKMEKWCYWQEEDNEGVYCSAHLHEDRVFNCPYENLENRNKLERSCSDYEERV